MAIDSIYKTIFTTMTYISMYPYRRIRNNYRLKRKPLQSDILGKSFNKKTLVEKDLRTAEAFK